MKGPEDFVLDLTVVRNAKIQDLFIMIKYATTVRNIFATSNIFLSNCFMSNKFV